MTKIMIIVMTDLLLLAVMCDVANTHLRICFAEQFVVDLLGFRGVAFGVVGPALCHTVVAEIPPLPLASRAARLVSKL